MNSIFWLYIPEIFRYFPLETRRILTRSINVIETCPITFSHFKPVQYTLTISTRLMTFQFHSRQSRIFLMLLLTSLLSHYYWQLTIVWIYCFWPWAFSLDLLTDSGFSGLAFVICVHISSDSLLWFSPPLTISYRINYSSFNPLKSKLWL